MSQHRTKEYFMSAAELLAVTYQSHPIDRAIFKFEKLAKTMRHANVVCLNIAANSLRINLYKCRKEIALNADLKKQMEARSTAQGADKMRLFNQNIQLKKRIVVLENQLNSNQPKTEKPPIHAPQMDMFGGES